ncbi:MAG: M28 family peptidase, partial [Chthoniobacterales bacterium]
ETIGYFSNAKNSQAYPLPGLGAIYPTTGNFIAFVGNVSSRALVRRALGSFRQRATLPSEGAALPSRVPGVGWSDHWAFWEQGYSAMMITDTAPFRYPQYHARTDTPDKLDYDSMTRLVSALQPVIAELAGEKN